VLNLGDTVTDAIDLISDIDQYVVNATAGDTVVIYVQSFDPDTSKRLRVVPAGYVAASGFEDQVPFERPLVSGLPLLANHSIPLVPTRSGSMTIAVTGDGGSRPLIGAYRLAVGKITVGPRSVSSVLPLNTVVTISGEPRGALDHFTFSAPVGLRESCGVP
jgi:hypothetical protein